MIMLLISNILNFGIYEVRFGSVCNIDSQKARSIIRDVIYNTNVDDFAYTGDNSFIMIIDVLAKRKGYVYEEQIKDILSNYCDEFQIIYKEPINK